MPADTLPDGRHFGYVRAIDLASSPATLRFDLAEFLSGEEALRAREEDLGIPRTEPLENDYYVRNRDRYLRTLALAGVVSVKTVDWVAVRQGTGELFPLVPGNLEDLAASFRRAPNYDTNYHGATVPYWLEVRDGRVVAVEEQYVP